MLSCCTVHLCDQNDQAARLYAAYAGTAQAGGLAAEGWRKQQNTSELDDNL